MDPIIAILIFVLVALSGLFSGLTLGLLSLNPHSLKRKMKLGDVQAKKVYPIRKKGNLLLATLLLGNVAVNSTLAIVLGDMTAGIIAGIISTGLIVVFGEILPQAFISRYALSFGARTVWLVRIFIFLFYPFTKPIAMALDKALGEELPAAYNKKELLLLLEEQAKHKHSDVDYEEADMAIQTLRLSHKRVKDVMLRFQDVFLVREDQPLNKQWLDILQRSGHSRLPVRAENGRRIVGILFAKDLISITPSNKVTVEEIMRRKVIKVGHLQQLDTILELFREEKQHLFIVTKKKQSIGIVTLEDVLEEITGEIEDEYDQEAT